MKILEKKSLLLLIATIFTFLTFIYSGQALAGYPVWITEPPQESNAIVVVGVATAKTLEQGQRAAILSAANQVAEYIGVTVRGSGTSLRTMVEQRVEDEVKSSIGVTPLQSGLVKEWYFEEVSGRYKVFALVNYPRAEIEKIKMRLNAEEAEGITRARIAIRRGQSAWERGAVLEALRSFSEGLSDGRRSGRGALETEARSKILSLLQSLELSIVSGDGQVIETGKKQQGALVVRVNSRLEGEKLPVEGVPVQFEWGGMRIKKTESVLTDSKGEARLTLESVGLSTGKQRITASLYTESLLASVGIKLEDTAVVEIGQLKPPSVTFTLKVAPHLRSTRIILLIEEANMGRPSSESIVMQTLSEALQQAGFRVVAEHEIGRTNIERLQEAIRKDRMWPLRPEMAHEADIALIGTATTQKGSENMGVVLSSHADLFIRAVDLKSGAVVAQKNVLSLAGFGDTPELAGTKALIEAGTLAAEYIVNQLSALEEGEPDVNH